MHERKCKVPTNTSNSVSTISSITCAGEGSRSVSTCSSHVGITVIDIKNTFIDIYETKIFKN